MQRILSSALASHAGQRITIAGWIHRRRWLKSVAFLIVRDRAGLAQVVVTDAATRTRLEQFGEETAVRVTGLVTVNPAAPGGAELTDPAIMPLCDPVTELPVELHRPALAASLPTLLDHADITLRHPARQAVFRLSAALVRGFRSTLDQAGYTEIFTPKIVGSATESGANVFELDYFGRPAYLAQSPQFYKQTMVGVFERVYEVGPAFRAEPSDTARHLAEFTSLDVELGFIDSHRDVMAVLRDVLAGMMAGAGGLGFELPDVPREIPIVHFTEALAIAGADSEEPDLAPADERALGEWARREHGSDFLFVEGYPTAKRAFYTHPEPCPAGIDRGEYADHICRARCAPYSRGFDLLFRGVELVSGAQRLHRYRDYVAAITERGDAMEPYRDFLSVFAHGMPPHGGFAIGLERLVARLVGAANIREVTLFPRDLHRVSP